MLHGPDVMFVTQCPKQAMPQSSIPAVSARVAFHQFGFGPLRLDSIARFARQSSRPPRARGIDRQTLPVIECGRPIPPPTQPKAHPDKAAITGWARPYEPGHSRSRAGSLLQMRDYQHARGRANRRRLDPPPPRRKGAPRFQAGSPHPENPVRLHDSRIRDARHAPGVHPAYEAYPVEGVGVATGLAATAQAEARNWRLAQDQRGRCDATVNKMFLSSSGLAVACACFFWQNACRTIGYGIYEYSPFQEGRQGTGNGVAGSLPPHRRG